MVFNMVNSDSYNLHGQKLCGVLSNFLECKGTQKPRSLRTSIMGTWLKVGAFGEVEDILCSL